MKFLNNIHHRLAFLKVIGHSDQKNIDQLFTRVFSNEDGQKVLAYLHYITTNRVMSPSVSEEQLRHLEGQRALVQTIQKLADRGRTA
jgi:hypothetical protein